MELKIYRDTVTTMGTVCDSKIEVPIETEILIPDYLSSVFKIIKAFVHRVVLQKQIQAGHLVTEGYFRIEIFYQGEQQNLCSIEQKVPFSKQLDLKNCTDESCQIDVDGELQYINCRALSPRRLDVRGAYNLIVRAVCDVKQELVTALSENGIQQKNSTVAATRILTSREKQFTLEENIDFTNTPEAILHTETVSEVQEVKIISGKAVAKGQLTVSVTYRETDQVMLKKADVTMPFNQVVELEGADEDCQCLVCIEPIGCTIYNEAGEQPATRLSSTCLLTVRALKKLEYVGVADCFSTKYKTEVQYKELGTDILLDLVGNTADVTAAGKLPDDSLRIIDCFADCTAPEIIQENGKSSIRGRISAHLICVNELGEIECYDKNAEYILPKRYEEAPEDLTANISASCVGVRFSQKAEEASAEISVQVRGFICRKVYTTLVENVTCGQELEEDDDVALRIYYAAQGETVFDIAKRYHASPSLIAGLAGIDSEALEADMRLLIPQTD